MAMARERLKQAVDAVGLGQHLRTLKRPFDSKVLKRDRRDNEHLRLLLAFVLAPESNCIDVGCHNGDVLGLMTACAPHGRHVAYEPLPHLCRSLAERFPSVDVRCAALSDAAGSAEFVYVKSHPAYSGLRRRTYPGSERVETIQVRTEVLDTSLPAGYVPTLIKIDVEGAERQVLEGAIETISRHKPVVVFEHGLGGADHYQTTPIDVFRLLCHQGGLRIFDMDGGGPYGESQFEHSFHSGKRWNYVAHR